MSLNFAAISPHPPIIVPQIAEVEDLQKVGNTVLAMKKLAAKFNAAEIDTLVIISPHQLVYPDSFNVCAMEKLFGTFASFSHPEIVIDAQNDLDFVAALQKSAKKADINLLTYDNNAEFFELDHGSMVPLSFLKQNEYSFKVVPIAYSNQDRAVHFAFGQVLSETMRNYPGRVGLLASGDLSHALLRDENGKNFDKTIVLDLEKMKNQEILYYDEDFVANALECGYRSILILLGALDGLKAKSELLSYEGPFGVGYLVLNYQLGSNS